MCQIIAYHAGNWREVGDLDTKIESIMTLLKIKVVIYLVWQIILV